MVLIFTIRLTKYQWNLLRYDSDLHPLEMDMNFFYFILRHIPLIAGEIARALRHRYSLILSVNPKS